MALCHDRMQAHQLRKIVVIDARRRGQGLGDGRVDVEVAAFEDRPSTDVLLKENYAQASKLFEPLSISAMGCE